MSQSDDFPLLSVRVWGHYACFTRPEMKAERVTYPVPPPSAARGILEAIFWKPEFVWRVREIWGLKPIRYFSILRNEVNEPASHRAARSWVGSHKGYVAQFHRAQRHTLALRDVEYIIRARIDVKPYVDANPAKYVAQFKRRLRRGACFHRPYLGTREFAAYFSEPMGDEQPIDLSMEIGRMLYDLDYKDDGRGTPRFFSARLERGILRVPVLSSEGV